MKKLGKKFQKGSLTYYNPIDDIILKYCEESDLKHTFKNKHFFKKTIMSHLKTLSDYILEPEGINLPHNLGKLKVLGYKSQKPHINWKLTNDVAGLDNRTKGSRKLVYYVNAHTNGLTYKIFYQTYYNSTKGIKNAYYVNRELWKIDSARLLNEKLKNILIDQSKPINYATVVNFTPVTYIPLNKRLNEEQRINW